MCAKYRNIGHYSHLAIPKYQYITSSYNAGSKNKIKKIKSNNTNRIIFI